MVVVYISASFLGHMPRVEGRNTATIAEHHTATATPTYRYTFASVARNTHDIHGIKIVPGDAR